MQSATRLDKKFDAIRDRTEKEFFRNYSGNRALNKLASNKLALLGLGFAVLMIFASLFAPFITDYDPLKVDLRMMLKPPSTDHILGTD